MCIFFQYIHLIEYWQQFLEVTISVATVSLENAEWLLWLGTRYIALHSFCISEAVPMEVKTQYYVKVAKIYVNAVFVSSCKNYTRNGNHIGYMSPV